MGLGEIRVPFAVHGEMSMTDGQCAFSEPGLTVAEVLVILKTG